MTKVAVLIPSHIYYKGQIFLLDKCINSIIKQTIQPNIYISISFDNESYKKEFTKKILLKYGEIVTFKFSKVKLYQMEHLYNISSKIHNKYDMFMFCDDDDTYDILRVEKFIEYFEQGKKYQEFGRYGGVREYFKSNNPELEIPEYWAYGIVPSVIIDFFKFFKDINYILLKHKFGDMYFRHYLRKNKKYLHWCGILEEKDGNVYPRLYNYNINNPNSICGRIEKGTGDIKDNIILEILKCNNDNKLNNILSEYTVILSGYLPNLFKYIYEFCKKIYKDI